MPPTNTPQSLLRKSLWSFFAISFSILIPLISIILVYPLGSFDPAPIPIHELTQPPKPAKIHSQILKEGDVEFLGKGLLQGPEDFAYDSEKGLIYTSCADGWIKRVTVNDSAADSVVESWVNTGGRPLGLIIGKNKELLVADANQGLLKINEEGKIEVLTKEAEGVKLKLTDGVDIAEDGIIYFSDASYKYSFNEFFWDILEGKPHGRLLSFDSSTNTTQVLLTHLYFANGVTVSPDQHFLVFCESLMRRCRKYYIKGTKRGEIENFISLPGVPDNIHYDGNGQYWIALSSGRTTFWDILYRYPIMRKVVGIIMKISGPIYSAENGGIIVVDLEGNPIAHYHDHGLKLISTGLQIGHHLYCGSIITPFIFRFNLDKLS